MDIPNPQPVTKSGAFTKLRLKLAGVSENVLRQCPMQDWDNARAIGEIMLCTWLYETALFSLIGHRLFAAPGQIRLELLLAAAFISSYLVLFDSYAVNRSGWFQSGTRQLAAAGLDIGGSVIAQAKAFLYLVIRVTLAIGFVLLTGVFTSIEIFSNDIDAKIQADYRVANAHLLTGATQSVDLEITRAPEAVAAQNSRAAALSSDVNILRQNEIDPRSADPQVQQAQQELSQLLAQKAKADDDVRSSESFASDELGGIVGTGASGRPGHGPLHHAAQDKVANARRHAQEAAHALETARARLDALRKRQQQGPALEAMRQQAHDQAPSFEARLAEANAKLVALNEELTRLTHGRNDAIRATIEKAPGHVDLDNGLLAQIKILEQLSEHDDKIRYLIWLIELTSYGFELAALLSKISSAVKTSYGTLVVRDAFLSDVHIVDAMVKELNPESSTDPKEPAIVMPPEPANDNWPAHDQAVRQNPFNGPDDQPPPPPKRPRGRPRKSLVPTEH